MGVCTKLETVPTMYDASTAHMAIVFAQYMLLAIQQRENENQRFLSELFFYLVDEIPDITFIRIFRILMYALMVSFQEILKLSNDQLTAFTADFETKLQKYLCKTLHSNIIAT